MVASRLPYLVPALALALMGCAGPDTDGDGLGDKEEERLGTDPSVPDSDEDGLVDGDEVERGTDPLLADSDGDRFLDGEEIERGTDPLDMQSAYLGGWPVVDEATKAGWEAEGVEGVPSIGAVLNRLEVSDHLVDRVDLYDLAGYGVPIVGICASSSIGTGSATNGDLVLDYFTGEKVGSFDVFFSPLLERAAAGEFVVALFVTSNSQVELTSVAGDALAAQYMENGHFFAGAATLSSDAGLMCSSQDLALMEFTSGFVVSRYETGLDFGAQQLIERVQEWYDE